MPTYKIQLPDGTVEAVPDALAADAVRAGGKIVGVVDVNEELGAVTKYGRRTTTADPEAVGLTDPAAARLAQVEGDYANSFGDEDGQAFMEGALRSVTAGLLGGGSRDEDTRAAVNPGAAMGGELAGLVGPGILGVGAPGLAAKAGATAARGVASTVGKVAVEGAVDALTFATARETIGSVVHDKPFSVEAIALEGALGAGIGAGLGAAAKGAGALRKALTKEDIAKDTVTRIMAGMDQVVPAVPDLPGVGIKPSSIGVDTAEAIPGVSRSYSTISATDAPGTKRAISIGGKAPTSVKEFYASAPHMEALDTHVAGEWEQVRSMFDDMAKTSSTSPQYLKADRQWAIVAEERRALAKALGIKRSGLIETAGGKTFDDFPALPADTFRSRMTGSAAKNEEAIVAYERFVTAAKKLSEDMADLKAAGDIWYHTGMTKAARTGEDLPTSGTVSSVESLREEADRFLRKRLAGAASDEQHALISEIVRRDSGKAAAKSARAPNKLVIDEIVRDPKKLASLKELLARRGIIAETPEEIMEATRGLKVSIKKSSVIKKGTKEKGTIEAYSEGTAGPSGSHADVSTESLPVDEVTLSEVPGYKAAVAREDKISLSGMSAEEQLVRKRWDKKNARTPSVILKSLEAGEPPHIEELLMLDRTEQRAVLDGLSQSDFDSLAAEIRASDEIVRHRATSTGISGGLDGKTIKSAVAENARTAEELARISKLETAIKGSESTLQSSRIRFAKSRRQELIGKDPFAAAPAKAPPSLGQNDVAPSGNFVVDALRRTNMMGMAMAAMFPKMAAAKIIVEKYGARIAGAAEKALSNKAVGLTLRKMPVLPWASLLAPGGSDHDRNLRAIAEAAKNPAAFDAAIEQAMSNIDSDNPEKMVEARERVSTIIQYLIRNMPPTLSSLKQVWSPSSVGAFNTLVRAAFDPVGVFEDAATAPTEQINAAKEMHPETYSHWMTELVGRVAEAAANGKSIPRHIGRFLPMASPAWSPDGMAMLQTVKTEKVQAQGGDQMNASVMAPKTDVEAMSQNRIGLNK